MQYIIWGDQFCTCQKHTVTLDYYSSSVDQEGPHIPLIDLLVVSWILPLRCHVTQHSLDHEPMVGMFLHAIPT